MKLNEIIMQGVGLGSIFSVLDEHGLDMWFHVDLKFTTTEKRQQAEDELNKALEELFPVVINMRSGTDGVRYGVGVLMKQAEGMSVAQLRLSILNRFMSIINPKLAHKLELGGLFVRPPFNHKMNLSMIPATIHLCNNEASVKGISKVKWPDVITLYKPELITDGLSEMFEVSKATQVFHIVEIDKQVPWVSIFKHSQSVTDFQNEMIKAGYKDLL